MSLGVGGNMAMGAIQSLVPFRMIPDNAVVFPEFNKLNPDMKDKRYNSLYGMYEPNCGLDKLCFAYGHDEYMYKASFLGSIVQIT